MVFSHSNATRTLHGLDRALDLCEILGLFSFLFISVWFEQTENTSLGGAAAHWGAERSEAERRRGWSVSKRSLWCCTSESDFPALRGGVRGCNHGRWLKFAVLPFFWVYLYMYICIFLSISHFFSFIYLFLPPIPNLTAFPLPWWNLWVEVAQAAVGHRSFPVSVAVWHQQRDSGVKSCLLKIRTSRRLARCWGEPCVRNDCDQRRPFHDG